MSLQPSPSKDAGSFQERSTRKRVLPTVKGWIVTLIPAMLNRGAIHTGIIDDGTCTGPKFCAFVEELVSKIRGINDMDGAQLEADNAGVNKTTPYS
ncbi:unnamed protein product [Heligmosomoides polygyrus]|uniref:Transposase n=1 Tax=Heligmosomoides polygyrus TaxID=6339 RepID=A0A183FX38_HELPZ|nr:unnamed protein product [Heligmosomoides polygyrus]